MFFSFCERWISFAWEHPGIALVFIGVAGEGTDIFVKIFFKKWSEKHHLAVELIGFVFWAMVVLGLGMEMGEAAKSDNKIFALQHGLEENTTNINRIDPLNLPILDITAYAKLRINGKDFPDLSSWGGKRATLMLCEEPARSSFPLLESDDFIPEGNFPDWREYFLKFHLDTFSATTALPMKNLAKSIMSENLVSIDAGFLPPKSEILDGYVLVSANNSTWQLFHIYPQTNSAPYPSSQIPKYFTVQIMATNVPDGKFNLDWWK
jgi:hypothetical protein